MIDRTTAHIAKGRSSIMFARKLAVAVVVVFVIGCIASVGWGSSGAFKKCKDLGHKDILATDCDIELETCTWMDDAWQGRACSLGFAWSCTESSRTTIWAMVTSPCVVDEGTGRLQCDRSRELDRVGQSETVTDC